VELTRCPNILSSIAIFLVFLSPSMNISRIEPQIQLIPLPFTYYLIIIH